jgi:hypothetical protein
MPCCTVLHRLLPPCRSNSGLRSDPPPTPPPPPPRPGTNQGPCMHLCAIMPQLTAPSAQTAHWVCLSNQCTRSLHPESFHSHNLGRNAASTTPGVTSHHCFTTCYHPILPCLLLLVPSSLWLLAHASTSGSTLSVSSSLSTTGQAIQCMHMTVHRWSRLTIDTTRSQHTHRSNSTHTVT